jgi:hypothetical protein
VCESLEGQTWLYRGVPEESPEVADVHFNGEVHPRRPGCVGEDARRNHSRYEMTDSGYTSWSKERDTAIELGQYASRNARTSRGRRLSGRVVVFKVRITTIEVKRIFEGEVAEDEYLIEGTVEGVEFSEDGEYD